MCGFAGFFDPRGTSNSHQRTVDLQAMIDTIKHRGPDASGTWIDDEPGIGLGHRRLSILELSAAGSQPLQSHDGRFVISFNGEIYNHLDLRLRLRDAGKDIRWRGSSDTETLVEAIGHWGIMAALKQAYGMFAFALWDRQSNSLILARDRFGEKPLYFGWQGCGPLGKTLLFGSELKALKAHRAFQNQIDPDAVRLYFQHGYVPGPHSIYNDIRKLAPGTYVTFRAGRDDECSKYWSQPKPVGVDSSTKSLAAWTDELDHALGSAVERQMLSDVPFGAFLSGGVDSSTIVALMQSRKSQPIRTFTIGSEHASLDETENALAVAQIIGTDHSTLVATDIEARTIIPKLAQVYDEPFADSSQIPTILVSRLASHSVKVVLSGDGGDELFAGYDRYHLARKTFRAIAALPLQVRKRLAALLRNDSSGTITAPLTKIGRFRGGRKNLHDLIIRAAQLLDAPTAVEINSRLGFRWQPYENPSLLAHSLNVSHSASATCFEDSLAEMTLHDLTGYLIDNILVKVDRAAMSQSIETRVPMLDPEVVALAASIPMRHKVSPSANKKVLREVLYRYVPQALVDRSKRGFAVPLHEWLRGPLRTWADDLLSPERLKADGILDAAAVERTWIEHRSSSANHQWKLWPVLMFQSWLNDQERHLTK